MKDASVNRAQRRMGTACRTRLDSSQAMHREPLKCLSGQAMGSNVHFRKIALDTRAWKEEHFGKGHKWRS